MADYHIHMKALIIRHGEAAMTSPDPQRQLTERGRDCVKNLAKELGKQSLGFEPKSILHSPFTRTTQTAHILHEEYFTNCDLNEELSITPNGQAQQWIEDLSSRKEDCILVTHNPFAAALVSELIEPMEFLGMPTAAAYLIEVTPSGNKLLFRSMP